MRGAPQGAYARLISQMSVRSSAETFGLPTRLRDRQRQYARNPARCQRMMVSGLTIATTSRTDGNQRKSQTNRKRSVLLRCGRFGVRRRSTLSCCRRTRFSASSVALALKREARIPSISLNRSVIRMRAYAVRLLRLRRIEFSVHTAFKNRRNTQISTSSGFLTVTDFNDFNGPAQTTNLGVNKLS